MLLSFFTSLHNKLKHNFFIILILLFTAGILLFMFFLNDVVINVRMLEFKFFLRMINREDSNIDYLEMVAKYKLHKELYENTINEKRMDQEELRLAAIATDKEKLEEISIAKYERMSQVVIPIINVIRYILDKDPIEKYVNDYTNEYLDVAYYYERNKYYRKALEVYNRILKQQDTLLNDKKPLIILHQGYCYSIVGDYQQAKSKFLDVINNYDNESVVITAAILYRYIEDFEAEIEKVKNSDEGSIEKSEKLFKLIAYEDALDILDKIEIKDEEQQEKIKYYKARCLEETGQKEKSIELYQDIIYTNHESKFAKLSNRRILVTASIDDTMKELKKLATKNNSLIQDEEFGELIKKSKDLDKVKEESKQVQKDYSKLSDDGEDVPDLLVEVINENKKAEKDKFKFNDFILKSAQKIENKKVEIIRKKEEAAQKRIVVPNRYNKTKMIKEKIDKSWNIPSDLIKEKKYDTDNKGNKITDYYSICHKDKNGVIYKAEKYDSTGKLLNIFIYEYDDAGNPITVNVYDSEGKLIDYF